MRSKMLFNKKFFIQNILKSKAIIAVILGIIPILNAIFIMTLSQSSDVQFADLNEISILNILGLYVVPIILAFCMIGYVFKRKSVDFINSMPLSRKEIYVTSVVGGIILIVLMQLINTLILVVESAIFTSLIVPFNMILDYFIVWTVSYIFVFITAALATTITGNHITMIIVTMLILFLVPFLHQYITTGFGYTFEVETINDYDIIDYNNDFYVSRVLNKVNYTLPYGYLSIFFRGSMINAFNTESIIKMVGLSIIYFFLGMYLFNKRKMEVNETSFKRDNIHYLVKSLTMLPICTFAMYIIGEEFNITLVLFLLALIVAYSLIYDLISTKSIKNLKLGILYFIGSVVIYTLLYYGVNYLNSDKDIKSINTNDITSVAYYIDNADYYSDSEGRFSKIYLDDKYIIDYTKDIIKSNLSNSKRNYENSIQINIKLNNKNEYKTRIYFDSEEKYNECLNLILNNEKYVNEYKDIDYDNIKLVKIGNIVIKDSEKFLTNLKESINNNSLVNLKNVKNVDDIKLYGYVNHENIEYSFPVTIDNDLLKEYIKIANNDFLNKIKNTDFINIFNIYSLDSDEYLDFDDLLYNSNDLNIQNSIIKFMKENIDKPVDIENVIKIEGNVRNNKSYDYESITYFTSDIEGLYKAINYTNINRGE